MTRTKSTYLALLALLLSPMAANAAPIDLFDHAYNVDGTITGHSDALPGYIDESSFDTLLGLGVVRISVTGAGAHSILAFFDHEIDEALNTFFNEWALGAGVIGVGQSAEADEPGFLFGDIYDNFLNNTLDNSNGGLGPGNPDDVSMAMGWDFGLAAGEEAIASFFLSETDDSGGAFRIAHGDDSSPDVINFWSTLEINATSVPEPSTLALFGLGLFAMGLSRRRKKI